MNLLILGRTSFIYWVSLKLKGEVITTSTDCVRLDELDIGDKFQYSSSLGDIFELVGKPYYTPPHNQGTVVLLPSLPIRHLDGSSWPHDTILYLGRNQMVERISCSLLSHYRQNLATVLNEYSKTLEK